MREGMKPIPAERLPEMIGRPIHLVWANPACAWILERIDGEEILLRTPRTNRLLKARATDACYTRFWAERA